MHVVSLDVADFRNYQQQRVVFPAGVSVLVGANGQGKTNLVEAIGYAATLSSHRVASDSALVRVGTEAAAIRVTVRRGARQAVLDVAIRPGRGTRTRINSSPLPRARDCLGLVRAVVFAPEDLALVKGDPSERRRLLDELLIQQHPSVSGVIADCERVLRQRGALLKAVARRGGRPAATDVATLQVWDEQFAALAGKWWAARLAVVEALREPFRDAYSSLAGGASGTGLQYRSSAAADAANEATEAALEPDESRLREVLQQALPLRHDEEWRRGVNLTGPQRDDLLILLHDHPAKGFASHGESWSLALALRLASYHVLASEAIDSGGPVLLLDDVFAELDAGRRDRLAEAVAGAEQVIITAAVEQDVPGALSGTRFRVDAGNVEEVAS